MVIALDQHAIHERIRYEFLMIFLFENREVPFESVFVKSERSEIKGVQWGDRGRVEAEKSVILALETYRTRLGVLGCKFELDSGGVTFLSVPRILQGKNGLEILQKVAEICSIFEAKTPWSDASHPFISDLQQFCCKNAVKFGEDIRENTARKLLRDLAKCQFPFVCIHGRQSAVPIAVYNNI